MIQRARQRPLSNLGRRQSKNPPPKDTASKPPANTEQIDFSKVKRFKKEEITAILNSQGFYEVGGHGSHAKYENLSKPGLGTFIVLMHPGDVDPALVKQIAKRLRLTNAEFQQIFCSKSPQAKRQRSLSSEKPVSNSGISLQTPSADELMPAHYKLIEEMRPKTLQGQTVLRLPSPRLIQEHMEALELQHMNAYVPEIQRIYSQSRAVSALMSKYANHSVSAEDITEAMTYAESLMDSNANLTGYPSVGLIKAVLDDQVQSLMERLDQIQKGILSSANDVANGAVKVNGKFRSLSLTQWLALVPQRSQFV
jgi:predicted RNA binding protein YcfA (HicA-like mRNA interferase family)